MKGQIMLPCIDAMVIWPGKLSCYKSQALTSTNYPSFKDASFAPSLKIWPNLSKMLGFLEFFRNSNSLLVNQKHEYSFNVLF